MSANCKRDSQGYGRDSLHTSLVPGEYSPKLFIVLCKRDIKV